MARKVTELMSDETKRSVTKSTEQQKETEDEFLGVIKDKKDKMGVALDVATKMILHWVARILSRGLGAWTEKTNSLQIFPLYPKFRFTQNQVIANGISKNMLKCYLDDLTLSL